MEPVRRAVIDVGTNSIKLLVADVSGRDVQPVHEESRQTRLGKGFYETRRLQPEAIARTAEAVWEFAEIAREKNADSIRVIATSAARDAVNPERPDHRHRTRVRPEDRNHFRRARGRMGVSRRDHRRGTGEGSRCCCWMSAAAARNSFWATGEQKHFAHSFPLGTVRLMEKFPHSDPPTRGEFNACRDWVENFLHHEVRPQLEPALRREASSTRRNPTRRHRRHDQHPRAHRERNWTASTANELNARS